MSPLRQHWYATAPRNKAPRYPACAGGGLDGLTNEKRGFRTGDGLGGRQAAALTPHPALGGEFIA